MWKLLLVLLVSIFGILLLPSLAQAATSVDVTITAIGVVVEPPSGFSVSYVSDYETYLSWTKPAGAVATMVRAAYGRIPTSITDGYLVYNGADDNVTDYRAEIAASEPIYYRAWSETGAGDWGAVPSEADTEEMMSLSYTYIGLIIILLIAVGMAVAAFFTKNRLLSSLSGFLFIVIAIGSLMNNTLPMSSLITLFAGIMTIAMFITTISFKPKEELPPAELTTAERIQQRIEQTRGATGQFRAKGKDVIL